LQLKEFSLINPIIESSEVFKAIETAIPSEMLEQAIGETSSQQQRQRKLPSGLVISLVIAMSLWSSVSMRTVLKNLVSGLSQKWIQVAEYWQVPNSGSISEARQRLGCAVMTRLFELVARPMASPETAGAFIGGLRVMAVDGTVMDVPDSAANARVFGYPGSKPGTKAAFPKARLVLLIETGTHLIVDALICPYRMGERVRIQKLLRSVSSGMLLMWDRGLHSYKMVNATIKQSCHYLGRLPANVKFEVEEVLEDGSYLSWINPDGKSRKQGAQKIRVRIIEYTIDSDVEPKTYRLITSLMDIVAFPAILLATEYHQRWEIESTIDELKTHLLGRKVLVRSLNPREVVQEIYGWLLGHWSIRYLIFQAAESAKISPLRIGFTGTLNVIRRAIPHFQSATPAQIPFF
jgi:Insertion element 4 transposase N-terminal/Transposase DDE domain